MHGGGYSWNIRVNYIDEEVLITAIDVQVFGCHEDKLNHGINVSKFMTVT